MSQSVYVCQPLGLLNVTIREIFFNETQIVSAVKTADWRMRMQMHMHEIMSITVCEHVWGILSSNRRCVCVCVFVFVTREFRELHLMQ